MARLRSIGFELNTVTNGVEVTTNNFGSGTAPTVVTTPVNTGIYAMKHTATASNSSAMYQFSSGGIGVAFIRGWFNVGAYPLANCTILDLGTAAAAYGGIFMNSSGQLGINYNLLTVNTYDTTLTSAVSLNTWHYIDLKIDSTTANVQIVTGYLDGVLINTMTGTRVLGSNSLTLGVWGVGLRETATATVYFDDIAINDGTGSFQNTYVGNSQLVRATPNGTGDSNTWLTGSGGTAGSTNNYTRVNELTPNGATSYNLYRSPTSAPSDLYTVSVPTIPSGATVNVVELSVWYAGASASANSQFELQLEKTSGGTISQSSAITPNATTYKANANAVPANSPLVLYSDPDGTPWTLVTVASMQIGMFGNSASTNYAEISTVWGYVDYTVLPSPPPAGPISYITYRPPFLT